MRVRERSNLSPRAGMTLTDGVVALAVLAVLAGFLVPQFQSRSDDEVALQRQLQDLRDRVELHRFRHDGRLPGDAGTEADLLEDLFSNDTASAGSTAVLSLQKSFPANPINGKSSVLVSEMHPRDGSTGWWYQPSTGEIQANFDSQQHGSQPGSIVGSL